MSPTPRMVEWLDAIKRLSERGAPPSYRQLGREMGVRSTQGVHAMLNRMRRRGLVDFQDHSARSITIRPEGGLISNLSTLELRRLRTSINAEIKAREGE